LRAKVVPSVSQDLSGQYRRLVWFIFAAGCWALWNVRNKLNIEGSIIAKPANVLIKMLIYMHQCQKLVRSRDRGLLDAAMGEIRFLHTAVMSP
jgi:RsiW-degrading membrane proteinase PrsW (M82 family)